MEVENIPSPVLHQPKKPGMNRVNSIIWELFIMALSSHRNGTVVFYMMPKDA